MSDSLGRITVRNIGYNSLAKVFQLVFSGIASIILTRTLVPGDYGIVGFAGILISFLTQFGDLGLTSAAIQRKDLSQTELYTALTIKVILGLVICLVAYLGAPMMVNLFDDPAIVSVVQVLSLIFVLNSLSFLPNLVLTRELNYKKISLANLIAAFVNSTVAVALALMGYKYWSLVSSMIAMNVTLALIINLIKPIRYRFAFDRQIAKSLLGYGGNLFISGFTVFLIFNADNFLIGAIRGSTELGYYSVAFTWGTMVCTMMGSMVIGVLFPTFSRIQDDKARLRNYYLKTLRIVFSTGALLNMTLFVVSEDWLVLVLGHGTDKWLPALTTFRVICVYGVVRLFIEPIGPVMMALGRTDVIRRATFVVALIELAGLYPVLERFGIEGVAVLVTIAYLSTFFVFLGPLRKALGLKLSEVLRCVAPVGIASVCFAEIFIVFGASGPSSLHVFVTKIAACAVSYCIVYGLASRWRLYYDMRGYVKGY